ncbi:MAG: hypothetical protein HQM10_23910 [Candidatus Riflebacteria bacterium]|nr:hypothetical protein [Candidatus Riflebacteria bacterium]
MLSFFSKYSRNFREGFFIQKICSDYLNTYKFSLKGYSKLRAPQFKNFILENIPSEKLYELFSPAPLKKQEWPINSRLLFEIIMFLLAVFGAFSFFQWYFTPEITVFPLKFESIALKGKSLFPITVKNNTSETLYGVNFKITTIPHSIQISTIDLHLSSKEEMKIECFFEGNKISYDMPIAIIPGLDRKDSPAFFVQIPLLKPAECISFFCEVDTTRASEKLNCLILTCLNFSREFDSIKKSDGKSSGEWNHMDDYMLKPIPDMKSMGPGNIEILQNLIKEK